MVEPRWGVEPQTYALRVRPPPITGCSVRLSVHVEMLTVLRSDHSRTPLEATKEATAEIK